MREARGGVLVIGGGFAGGYVARLLGKRGATIVSPENFMLYTPMLPEAASGTLEPRHVVVPLRQMCPHAELLLARVTAIDEERRVAAIERPDGGTDELHYEQLVVALGAVARSLPVPGLAEHALGFKDLADAIHLRNHVLRELEAADAELDPARAAAHLTFVFVGAGYAGVEALAELSDLVKDALRWYPRLRTVPQRWVLVDAAPKILPEIPTRLGEYAARELARRGVEIRTSTTLAVGHGGRGDALGRRADPDAHARLDGRRSRAPAAERVRTAARRARACPRRSVPPGRGPRAGVGARRLRRRPERRDARARRSADLPARAPPGAPAGQEPERHAAAVRLPDARPGGDARPLQGDRRRDGAAPPRLPGLVRHAQLPPPAAAAALPQAARASSTGRPRSSSAATSPSSRCSVIPGASAMTRALMLDFDREGVIVGERQRGEADAHSNPLLRPGSSRDERG